MGKDSLHDEPRPLLVEINPIENAIIMKS